jgi:hypothetical protein
LPGWGFVRAVVHRLWSHGDDTRALANRDTASESEEWVPIASEGPAPLLEMYRDLLSKNGIPAMLRSEGAGRGAMGGAPTMAGLLVPARYAPAARELLDLGGSDVDDRDGGVQSERI